MKGLVYYLERWCSTNIPYIVKNVITSAIIFNKLVNKWDRFIIDEWIPPMMHYNKNDVFIVCEMIRLLSLIHI